MRPDENRRLLLALAGAFPTSPMSEETAALWRALFERYELDDALPAVLVIVENDQRFPTIARFHEAHRMLARKNEPRALEASPTTPGEKARGHEAIARIRLMLAETVNPWGTAENPKRPPKDWHPTHTGDIDADPEKNTWLSCPVCHPKETTNA